MKEKEVFNDQIEDQGKNEEAVNLPKIPRTGAKP